MALHYVDPAAGGDNDGSSWINAWTNIQSAFDDCVAGDICYCRGTQTFADATQIDIDTNSGTNAEGHIKFIGCNASGNVDGTRFVLDVNSKDCHGLVLANGVDMVWLENIEVKNCGGTVKDGFTKTDTGSSQGCVFINCSSHNNSRYGFGGAGYISQDFYIRCTAYLNSAGFSSAGTRLIFCSSHDNTGIGISFSSGLIYGCIVYGNGDDGIYSNLSNVILNTVIDSNTDNGIELVSGTSLFPALILGCRITNHSGAGDIGLNAASENLITGWCYFEDNDGDNIQNATLHTQIQVNGSNTNMEDLANTNEGYVSKTDGSEDYTTAYTDAGDPDLRRTAITIPVV